MTDRGIGIGAVGYSGQPTPPPSPGRQTVVTTTITYVQPDWAPAVLHATWDGWMASDVRAHWVKRFKDARTKHEVIDGDVVSHPANGFVKAERRTFKDVA